MIQIRPSHERGCAEYGWLTTRHTFSFDQYHDPDWMGFRCLRVINEDVLAPGGAFPMHPHRDVEIITYVLEGALAHKDSLGNGSIIHPGDGQCMSAGVGIRHSEANPSPKDSAHLLQIWIEADRKGHEINYHQKPFSESRRRDRFCLVASPDGAGGSVPVHQDARFYVALLGAGQQLEYALAQGRGAWLQIGKGAIELNQQPLREGDGAAITEELKLKIKAVAKSEILLFDVA
jgi:redox-sensitive bicupin YhaK (pirin superfamily)